MIDIKRSGNKIEQKIAILVIEEGILLSGNKEASQHFEQLNIKIYFEESNV